MPPHHQPRRTPERFTALPAQLGYLHHIAALRPAALRTYLALACESTRFTGGAVDAWFYTTDVTLQLYTGLTDRSLLRARRDLRTLGLATITTGPSYGIPTHYFLSPQPPVHPQAGPAALSLHPAPDPPDLELLWLDLCAFRASRVPGVRRSPDTDLYSTFRQLLQPQPWARDALAALAGDRAELSWLLRQLEWGHKRAGARWRRLLPRPLDGQPSLFEEGQLPLAGI